MKKLLITMLTMLLLTGCSKVKQSDNPSEIILVDSPRVTITQADLNNNMSSIELQLKSIYGDDYKDNKEAKELYNKQLSASLDQLLNEKILREKAIDLSLIPTAEEIDAKAQESYEQLKSVYGLTDATNEQVLEKIGYSLEEYKAMIENQLIYEKLNAYIKKDMTPVDEEEAFNYYEENKEYFKINKGMEVAQIKLSNEVDAERVYGEIVNGKSFEQALLENNPDNASTNGYVGFIEYDKAEIAEIFMTAIKDLKEGEVAAPIVDKSGVYIIKAIKEREESYAQFDEIKENLMNKLNFQLETDTYNDALIKWGKELGVETKDENIQELK